MPARFTIPTTGWDERSYLQGVHILPDGTSLVVDADPAAAGETFEVHARTLAGKYLGRARAGKGHGSSIGVEVTGPTTCNLWHGDGYAQYRVGQTGTLPRVKTPNLPAGDVSIDQAADLLVVRTGSRYRGYRLSLVKAGGQLSRVFDFTVPGWGNRWQGMLVAGGRLFIHRDLATKSTSRVHVFDLKGKPVTVRAETVQGKTVEYNWVDTTRMGDEAEGLVRITAELARLLNVPAGVYVVKRTGGTGPSRVLVVTLLDVHVDNTSPPPPPPKPPAVDPGKPGGTWEVLADKLAAVNHAHGDKRDEVTYVRDKGYRITTGVRFVTATDSAGQPHTYLLTEAGYRYAVSAGPDRTGTPYLRKLAN